MRRGVFFIVATLVVLFFVAPAAAFFLGGHFVGHPIVSELVEKRDASPNWKMAGMLSVGGIPTRNTICATVSPLGSGASDTVAIQNAIDACPVGQVVSLAAGTFTIPDGTYVSLNKGITLRGAGPASTILTRTDGAVLDSPNPGSNPSPIIHVGAQRYGNDISAPTLLSLDGVAGAYSVTVTSAAGLAVGQVVLLDEASNAAWQPERLQDWVDAGYTQIWASADYRVVWQKHNPTYTFFDDFGSLDYPYQSGTAGCWFSACDRPTNELHQISAISGNVITFDSPLTISYRKNHQAQLYHWALSQVVRNAGIEDLAVSHGDDGNIHFNVAANSWVKNVENSLWLGHGFDITASFRIQLERAYVHDGAWPVNGGGGYAIAINWWSSELLIEDSISVKANKTIVAQAAGTGSVVAYSYLDDAYIKGQDSWVEVGANASHMVGPHHILFEGNESFNADSDQTHGNSIYLTFFRNHFSGFRKSFVALDGLTVDDAADCCSPMRAIGAHAYAYWLSFVGNVLGKPSAMSGWTYECVGGTNFIPNKCIWSLGIMDTSPQGDDANVRSTAFRDGNYDYLTNSVRWDITNLTHVLPSSLYLTAKPAFFGGNPWPWVDPANATPLYTLPAKARYDAGTPFAP